MCNCINEIECGLLKSVVSQYPEGKRHAAIPGGQALKIGRDGEPSYWVGFAPIEGSVELPLRKNPDTLKVKKLKLKMYFTYCPYCGVKYAS